VTDEEVTMIFERGDVVYGDDPFKGGENARPWLILSNNALVAEIVGESYCSFEDAF